MTEQQWMESGDPQLMLIFLQGKGTDRKLRLAGCAWCRRVWRFLPEEPCRKAIHTVELYLDGQATDSEVNAAARAVARYYGNKTVLTESDSVAARAAAACLAIIDHSHDSLQATVSASKAINGALKISSPGNNWMEEAAAQADILREIFGNPFQSRSHDEPWLTGDAGAVLPGAVLQLAQIIYGERRFALMPSLASELETHGCTDAEVLDHCRRRAPHVPGCWVLDLLLERR